jgi:hypothetical protein
MYHDGVEVASATATTDGNGWVFPFRDLTSDAAGEMVGDLIIRLSPPADSAVISGVSFPALAVFGPQLGLVRLGVGPS